MKATELVPSLRDLYSRLPEMYYRQPWELQSALFLLGYTDDLVDEAKIGAAVEVARGVREDVLLSMASPSEAKLVKGA